jgi:type I restriction enzyme R subunit
MKDTNTTERQTQNRVVKLFQEELGYNYLGNWADREGNSNMEEAQLREFLHRSGYSEPLIVKTVELMKRAAVNTVDELFVANKAVYELLRYGIVVQEEAGKPKKTVKLIDWENPERNDFYIAEEVTIRGSHDRRPDIVLYVNGIAVSVIELKSSRVSIGDGIRQLISNQSEEFNAWFFSTVQLVFAGSDSEGLKYGTTETPEKYFLNWKEDEEDNTRYRLDKYLLKMCNKERLLELMYDFVVFDGSVKKVPRTHQYFGLKEAQKYVLRKEGGIIWHTQGSGKSILMVLLAKWILENNANSRVVIVTDRDELDKQIKGVFSNVGEEIKKASSSRNLMSMLEEPLPRLMCSLVHKFGKKDIKDFDEYIKTLESQPSKTIGDVFVFVDECHRTQSGRLHRQMKAIMPNAVFIGFTGTPLLKKDKATSNEVFGGYIHTYQFQEAVEDGVVLDLIYEARDIDQELGSPERVDAWFESKAGGLNDWQQEELKKKWGTMQKVLSSKSRMNRVVQDIIFDFNTKPRLKGERGNAILVASSIYEATKYYTLFQHTEFKNKCAVVTSYDPQAGDVSREDTGEVSATDKKFIYDTYKEIVKDVQAKPNTSQAETYEDWAKDKFINDPQNMKLLIVRDKLLTGFDAPSCTYLYIDKTMNDHGLFQAICRTNRLDGDDKDYGYIVDYKNLFDNVENAIAVYSSELDAVEGEDTQIILKDRLETSKERLDLALEQHALICEPVEPPREELQYQHYFCGNTEIATDLKEHEPQRSALYKATATLMRAYANIADEIHKAGYSEAEQDVIKRKVEHAVKTRDMIKLASDETLDMKAYEADMRHLIDSYIEAKEPRKVSDFDNMGLIDVIINSGIAEAIQDKFSKKTKKESVAEAIENNVRSKIIKEHLLDPFFYDKMSSLLTEIIEQRRQKAIEYEEYLKRIEELTRRISTGTSEDAPERLDTRGKQALFNTLKGLHPVEKGNMADNVAPFITRSDEELVDMVEKVHNTVEGAKQHRFRGNQAKENMIKGAIYGVVQDMELTEKLFKIISHNNEY